MTTPEGPASDTAQLIQALKDNARRLGLTWQIALASVIDAGDPANILLQFDGDGSTTPGAIAMVPTSAGARVYVMQVPPSGNYIVGYAGPAALATVNAAVIGGGPTQTSSSNVFTNILNGSSANFGLSIAKKFNQTALRIDAAGTFYSTGAASGPLFGVTVTGVAGPDSGAAGINLPNHWVGRLGTANASLNAHTTWAGSIILPGLTAGLAVVRLFWQRNSGAGVLTMDTNDATFMTVSEVWPS